MRQMVICTLGVFVLFSFFNVHAQNREAVVKEADRLANLLRTFYSDSNRDLEPSDHSAELLFMKDRQREAAEQRAQITVNPFKDKRFKSNFSINATALGLISVFAVLLAGPDLFAHSNPMTPLIITPLSLLAPAVVLLSLQFPRRIYNYARLRKLVQNQRELENAFWDRLSHRGLDVPANPKLRRPWLESLFAGKVTDTYLKNREARSTYIDILRSKIDAIYWTLVEAGIDTNDFYLRRLKNLKSELRWALLSSGANSAIKKLRSVETQLKEMIIENGQFGDEVRNWMSGESVRNLMSVFAPSNSISCRSSVARIGGEIDAPVRFVSVGASLLNP